MKPIRSETAAGRLSRVRQKFWDIGQIAIILLAGVGAASAEPRAVPSGPLKVHPANGRYFATPDGKPILLAGSHTWAVVQDRGVAGQPPFDFDAFLAMCETNGHNFIRFWVYEHPEGAGVSTVPVYIDPLPWARPGPGLAADGKPKFNLEQWNEAYFTRLRERIVKARDRGFYVSVMLFNGWSLKKVSGKGTDPFASHPFNATNNVNGIGVAHSTLDSDDGPTLHSLKNAAALARQEAYVRKVVDTVNDLDNVLYDIINEGGALDWQRHFIRFIKDYEKTKPKRHPVGFTHRLVPRMWNEELFASEADWVSPANEPLAFMYKGAMPLQNYEEDPPASDGRKVVVVDSDHLWGHGGNALWVWKSVCRGHNPIFMDPWQPAAGRITQAEAAWFWDAKGLNMNTRDYPDWPPLRAAMGDAIRYASRLDLARAVPREDLTSTRYCLADVGEAYLIFAPGGGSVTLDLRGAKGPFAVEWFHPLERRVVAGKESLKGDDYVVLEAPFADAAVLFLHQQRGEIQPAHADKGKP